jgi:hypothetical protein
MKWLIVGLLIATGCATVSPQQEESKAQLASLEQNNPGTSQRESTEPVPEPESIPVEIETVITGGYWAQGTAGGSYRVIIRTRGFDHLLSSLTVQWIADPDLNLPRRVVASKTIEMLVRLSDPQFSLEQDMWFLGVSNIDTHDNRFPVRPLRFSLGPPNTMSEVENRK